MKKHILTFIFFLFAILVYCQNERVNRKVDTEKTNTYRIDYDFKEGVYHKNYLKPKVGFPIVFRITSINRLAYDISIKSKDSIISESFVDSEVIDFIKNIISENITQIEEVNLEPDSIDQFPMDPERATSSDEKNATVVTKEIFKIEQENKKFNEEIGGYEAELKHWEGVKEQLSISNESAGDSLSINKKIVVLKNTITSLNNIIISNRQRSNLLLEQIDNEYKEYLKKYFDVSDNLRRTYGTTLTLYQEISHSKILANNISLIASNPFLTKEEYENEHRRNLEKDLKQLKAYRKDKEQFNIEYLEFIENYVQLNYLRDKLDNINIEKRVITVEARDEIKSRNETLMKNVNLFKKNLESIDLDNIIEQSSNIKELLESDHTFEITSAPVQPKQDVIIFDVSINQKANNSYQISNGNRNFRHSENIRHGLRYDLSLGAGLSFFSNEFNIDIEDNSQGDNVIVQRDNDILRPSIVGLFTASLRSSNHWAFGLSAGVGITASDNQLAFDNFFFGPTLVMGRYERLMLTSGLALSNLPSLKKSYEIGDTVTNNVLENVADYSFRTGWFFSLTYNLTKGVRQNIKKIND